MPSNPLLSSAAQDYLFAHEQDDEQKLILKNQPVAGVDAKTMATQIIGRRKAKDKLPLWYKTKGIIYSPSLHLEQSSSQATALFKQRIIAEQLPDHKSLSGADLTCGFGVDSFFLHSLFRQFHSVEQNASLLEITQNNHRVLGAVGIHYHSTRAENFLASHPVEFIFIDPSRRINQQKVFRLHDTEPNVVTLQNHWLGFAKGVLIKASPMMDIAQGLEELKAVKKIWVVAHQNECKELLFWQQIGWQDEPEIAAVEIDSAGNAETSFDFTLSEEKKASATLSAPLTYLYEPNAALMKSGAFKLIALRFGLFKIDVNTHLYTSAKCVRDFPGRIFKIDQLQVTEEHLQRLPGRKANVLTRNFPQGPEALKKKLSVSDGGDAYLIAFKHQNQKFISLATREK